jgi:glycosyltransferase involved in cell wall biosynthesis
MTADTLATSHYTDSAPHTSAAVKPVGVDATGSDDASPAWPSASVIIPTFNEAAHLERVVTRFLATCYPGVIEVLVVDGGSTDGTAKIIRRLAQHDARVRLIHNPLKVQSAALNIGIAEMRGDIFLRADGHSDYAPDYIERCIETLLETKALNIGGSPQFVAADAFQAGVALASRSLLGAGGGKHRSPSYSGYCDTVSFGCAWRRDLERLESAQLRRTPYVDAVGDQRLVRSYFDLDQVTNQDSEINLRFRKVDPQAIYVSARIKTWYYPRATWKGLVKQFFQYGRGRCRTASLHPGLAPRRVKLPLLAGLAALILIVLDLVAFRGKLHMKQAALCGLCLPFLESARVTLKYRTGFETEIWWGAPTDAPALHQRWLWCGVALLTMTPAFLTGYLYQLIRRHVLRIQGW